MLRKLLRILTAPFRIIFWPFRQLGKLGQKINRFFTEEPEDTPVGDSLASAMQNPVGILEHLNALRKHLMRSVVVLVITTAIAFSFIQRILEWLVGPLPGGLAALRSIDPTETIGSVMRVALLAGFAVAFPYIAFEIWLFIAPGVSAKTRRAGLLAIPITTLFFLGGMAFAYYIMLPVALTFLFGFMDIQTDPRPATYFPFVASLMFWIGIAFEFPLVVFILATMKLVNAKMLVSQWRIAVVVIAVISALITPTTDPVNMALVMGPMVVLYILSIGLASLARRKETT
jgi:sec-independent protein translocase protein TatC